MASAPLSEVLTGPIRVKITPSHSRNIDNVTTAPYNITVTRFSMASSGGSVICLQWGWYFPCQSIIRVAQERYLFKWSSSRPQIASLLRVMYHSHGIVSPNNTSDQIINTIIYQTYFTYQQSALDLVFRNDGNNTHTCVLFELCVQNMTIWVKTWIRNGAREVQWDCGPCSLPGKEFAAWATNIFVSTILRKLDLGVSSVSSNQPVIMGPVSRFPKAFQNSK